MFDTELSVAKDIAYTAGAIMRQYFDSEQLRTIKKDGTPVTVADTQVNAMVIAELRRSFPEDGVIGEEESTADYGMGRRWICDPIDGTKAFTWGVPTAMFSLALVVDGVPKVGVCYEPMLDKMYWAVAGGEAFCNDTVIRVNDESLADGIVAVVSSAEIIRHSAKFLQVLFDRKVQLAVFSGAVAKSVRVAEGRFSGYIDQEYVSPHDIAAAQVIIQAAGGVVTGLQSEELDYSKPFRGVVVSNRIIHDELIGIVNSDG